MVCMFIYSFIFFELIYEFEFGFWKIFYVRYIEGYVEVIIVDLYFWFDL